MTTESLWEGTSPATAYPPLDGTVEAEVAVIGGGITGLTTAYLLAGDGVRVVLLEARGIAAGTTGHTTAKVTSLHGLTYAALAEDKGWDVASAYAAANQAGVDLVGRIASSEGIACDIRRLPAYTYTESDDRVADIEAEVAAAQRLGLPGRFATDVSLPYPVRAAIGFDDQLLFHPRLYCLGLAEAFIARGGRIFEQSRATAIDSIGGRHAVSTQSGTVTADWVIQATLLPFDDPGGLFAKTHPSRSYALAAEVDGPLPDGMFLGIDDPGRSVRPHQLADGRRFLVIGGEEHKTGQDRRADERFEVLEAWARERFGLDRLDYRWSAQDYMPADGIPYVGRSSPQSERMLVATGFRKWGMSNGSAAALMLSDIVAGRPNPWLEVFDATRLRLGDAVGELVRQNVDVARRFVGGRVTAVPDVEAIGPGAGSVIQHEGRRLAVYRDEAGTVHALSARCTHMGCLVEFNPGERSWDCPCHGSRFALAGDVLEGPATAPLEAVELPPG